MITLNGITWAHSRGYTPLVACSQAWTDLHPSVEIVWHKRSLWAFGEGSLDELRGYDLLVLDHPFTGRAAEAGVILPLGTLVPPADLADLERHSVGPSYRSYVFDGRQWLLPLDAAAQVAVGRADLLEQRGLEMPRTWSAVLRFARTHGGVTAPLSPINALSGFLTFCAQAGAPVKWRDDGMNLEIPAATAALEQLRELALAAGPESLEATPIDILNRMCGTNEILYVPLCYGYSNYSRPGFAPHVLRFADIPLSGDGQPRGACLGGAGIAVGRDCRHVDEAVAFARSIAGGECQRTLYVTHGGQPAHAGAWKDDEANRITNGFFRDTWKTLELAYLRPNFPSFPSVQEQAARVVHNCAAGAIRIGTAVDQLQGRL